MILFLSRVGYRYNDLYIPHPSKKMFVHHAIHYMYMNTISVIQKVLTYTISIGRGSACMSLCCMNAHAEIPTIALKMFSPTDENILTTFLDENYHNHIPLWNLSLSSL